MKKLKVAILSRIKSPSIINELAPELEKRGHTVDIIDVSVVPLNNFLTQPLIQKLISYDIVYYRSGLSVDMIIFLEAFLREQNIKTVNLHFTAHPFANSKTYGTIVAERNGLNVPKTLFNTSANYETILETMGSPFVIKTNDGARGENVHLIYDEQKLQKIFTEETPDEYLYQSFIPHLCEYRVHTIEDSVAAMYKRTPAEGDFRSNVSLGGNMHPVEANLVYKLATAAKSAAAVFDFEIMAVDFMLHTETGELYFTEINLNPGWEISDKLATGVDLSAKVSDYIENICA